MGDDLVFKTRKKYNAVISAIPMSKLPDQITNRDEREKYALELINRGSSPDPSYTSYEVVAKNLKPKITSYSIKLSFDSNDNPIFEPILDDATRKAYEGYRPHSTFLPINLPKEVNLVTGARAL